MVYWVSSFKVRPCQHSKNLAQSRNAVFSFFCCSGLSLQALQTPFKLYITIEFNRIAI